MLVADDIHHIRVYRRNPDGSVHLVRGADPNLSPGGIAPAYDHEAPLGALCAWWAVAYDRFGNEVYRTGEAAIATPLPAGTRADPGSWVKSLVTPSLSAQVSVLDWSEATYGSTSTSHSVIGNPYPVAQYGVRQAATLTCTLQTRTAEARRKLEQILRVGGFVDEKADGPVLIQSRPQRGYPDRYCMVGAVSYGRDSTAETVELWTWKLELTEIARPPTAGSRMRVPGSSYAGLPYNSWTEAGAAADTYLDL